MLMVELEEKKNRSTKNGNIVNLNWKTKRDSFGQFKFDIA